MNGTVTYVGGQGSGAIRSEAGETFDFSITAVLAYDVAAISAGQRVHFDVGSGTSPKAINISIDPACGVPAVRGKDRDLIRLRYLGFEHRGNVRSYSFQRLMPGEPAQVFAVDVDLVLFHSFHVNIQEGPALCLQL